MNETMVQLAIFFALIVLAAGCAMLAGYKHDMAKQYEKWSQRNAKNADEWRNKWDDSQKANARIQGWLDEEKEKNKTLRQRLEEEKKANKWYREQIHKLMPEPVKEDDWRKAFENL